VHRHCARRAIRCRRVVFPALARAIGAAILILIVIAAVSLAAEPQRPLPVPQLGAGCPSGIHRVQHRARACRRRLRGAAPFPRRLGAAPRDGPTARRTECASRLGASGMAKYTPAELDHWWLHFREACRRAEPGRGWFTLTIRKRRRSRVKRQSGLTSRSTRSRPISSSVSIPYLLTICFIKRIRGKYGYLAKFGRHRARGTDGLKFFRPPPGPTEADERDPDVAAVIDNVVEGFEIFSWPLSWGADGGAARGSHADMSCVAFPPISAIDRPPRKHPALGTNAAAHTRMVSVARIRLIPGNLSGFSKG
jgi:hypothetical protein